MLKKITTIIAQNKDAVKSKALVLGGITTGMLISAVLAKTSSPEVTIVEALVDEPVVTSEEADTTPES